MSDPSTEAAGRAVVHRYLDAVAALDLDALAATLHEDVVMDLPFAPEGIPQRVEGKPDVTAFFDGMPGMITPLNFHDQRVEAIAGRQGEFVAEYVSDAKILATGLPYRNTYIARFSVRDGRIVRFAEYFDPLVFVEALGGTVTPAGAGA